uniref:Uncharacterized protein n=1 Tax=Anguilla anguilla TaxID=7936 RepID=A0A0E9T559_ANGAN
MASHHPQNTKVAYYLNPFCFK